jgi:UDP-glucose 4-epimerase
MSGVFLVADGESISTADLLRRLAHLMHRPARLFALPVGVLRVVAAAAGQSAAMDRLCGSLQIDISETCERLGWSPPVTLDEELARTVDWYLEQRQTGTTT